MHNDDYDDDNDNNNISIQEGWVPQNQDKQ